MLISGIQQCTLLDYPGKIACIVFAPGCNFRCGYCHNPEFVLPDKIIQIKDSFIPEEVIFNFLTRRKNLLDGVVVSGGEPTLMPDLLEFIQKVKNLDFLVKLDTNGNRPEILEKAIENNLVNYVAMDIKTSLDHYPELVGKFVKPEKIKQSIEFLKQGSVDYEFRSTLIEEIHSQNILEGMLQLVTGAKRFFLQTFRPSLTLDPQFEKYHSFSPKHMEQSAELFRPYVSEVMVRV